jgi:hypothetical protein
VTQALERELEDDYGPALMPNDEPGAFTIGGWLEATKTVALEVWEQLGRRMPDVKAESTPDDPGAVVVAETLDDVERALAGDG